jgi:undecaprenyl diphosphate synthase
VPVAKSNATPVTGAGGLPRHIAIVMDGNGRWAERRRKPRFAGHRAGVSTVRDAVEFCVQRGVEVLTLFAFSSENWRRPAEEVGLLMNLFLSALQQEMRKLHDNGIRLRVTGDLEAFNPELRAMIEQAERLTSTNKGMHLVIAANYGGRWDVVQAARTLAERVARGEMQPQHITEAALAGALSLADLPEPDLLIRTGGDTRISNFLLWQLAYTELYFTETLWPDFDAAAFEQALASFAGRERRFGRTGDQVMVAKA